MLHSRQHEHIHQSCEFKDVCSICFINWSNVWNLSGIYLTTPCLEFCQRGWGWCVCFGVGGVGGGGYGFFRSQNIFVFASQRSRTFFLHNLSQHYFFSTKTIFLSHKVLTEYFFCQFQRQNFFSSIYSS